MAFIGVAFAGCSQAPGDGESAIRDQIQRQSEGRIRLASFQKTNGMQGELMGFKIYAMEFAAEIEFTEDCKWITGMFGQELSFKTSRPVAEPKGGFSWNSFMEDTTNPGTPVRKGQKAKLTGAINYVKKEKGWAVDKVQLAKADLGTVASAPPSDRPQIGSEERPRLPRDEKFFEAESFVNAHMSISLTVYRFQKGDYPSTAEGLRVLATHPLVKHDPYVGKIDGDPWGEPYQYAYPGTRNKGSYDLWSKGPDKTSGTADDIGNWK